jgi:hypothetical protein
MDESWFVSEHQHSTNSSMARDEVLMRMNQTIVTKKLMLTDLGTEGFHIIDMMPSGAYFNPECFLTQIMDHLLAKLFPEGQKQLPGSFPECANVIDGQIWRHRSSDPRKQWKSYRGSVSVRQI